MTAAVVAEPPIHNSAAEHRNGAVERIEAFVDRYCMDCHNAADTVSDLDLETTLLAEVRWAEATKTPTTDPRATWETVLRRIASRQMPPLDAERPDESEYRAVVQQLGHTLDHVARQNPVIPPTDSLRRLTRTEYQNSVRDLLGLELDITTWLPKDESSGGFDNITVGDLSASLMNRYLSAAEKISRIAVGRFTHTPMGLNVRLPADLTQEKHVAGLPLGTRGGTNIHHTFAETGEYEIAVRLTRDRDEMIEGLSRPHDLDVLVDRQKQHRWTIEPPKRGRDDTLIDANLKVRIPITAGPHDIAVTFVSQGESLLEIKRQPFLAAYNRHRHPRQQPALLEVSIVGPFADADPAATETSTPTIETPSRQRIFTAWPESSSLPDQQVAAQQILGEIARVAFRRDVTPADLATPLAFVDEVLRGESTDSWESRFELGIERGLAAILVNPNFLFHVEQPVQSDASEPVIRISDWELASRLAAFLWSSLPDDELLDLAAADQLSDPAVLRGQVTRMLSDERSQSLVDHFAAQWLYLRNLDGITPNLRQFPDFDENLRMAMRRETELLFTHVLQHDASVMGLIDSDFTYLNERLARHYRIPGVLGDEFRQVTLSPDWHRGGLLRHGSILSVTSYSTRTSPTVRGNWVLENIIGNAPPPPPPDIPALQEKSTLTATSLRERLAMHRENESCASCHDLIDPIGFALDHYDALGQYREYDGENPIDASGVLPDGTEVGGVSDLEASLLAHPEMFVGCLSEKMMTFALGRLVDYRDAPAIREIVRKAKIDDYRISSIIQGIVASEPFQYRSTQSSALLTEH
ncbi:DUF1592 domain-containing protein [Allorhodopirellula solitaria]|nr:DUF1592 domain-containing protein [Allorhodopirellula solitaria]